MAVVNTDEKFRKAISWLVDNGQLAVTGARFVDALHRKVFDETANGLVDITPDVATLESALDSANDAIATQNSIEAIRDNSENELKAIPNYYTWNATQAETWIDSNVNDLATAKQVLIALAKMNIAMRNKLFPHLEGS